MTRNAILLTLLAACSSPSPTATAPRDQMLDALEKGHFPHAAAGLLSAVVSSDVYAASRTLLPPTSGCSGATRPHPFLVPGVGQSGFDLEVQRGPVVGREFRVVFWTSAMTQTLGTLPTSLDAAWVVVGHDNAWAPRLIPEWPGCWQMVNPSAIVPAPVAAGWQGSLKREPDSPSRIELRWTPGAGSLGSRVQLQLMVFAPGITPHGFDLSQGVDLTVGNL